ncbi:hypothetical protein OHA98_42455 [Streptomyces sp. NBC_00654]|uniref:hypothetical protein n=1 Tax=Streptomyces sp. NBC_00654 TaxID=2975799 RepID=UPI002255D351|nr:hypothetical protein [Streptomyces sp. NBC_00654]MCX4971264.1 hypothetical protein [Streptomyces sp. NBC_00654]
MADDEGRRAVLPATSSSDAITRGLLAGIRSSYSAAGRAAVGATERLYGEERIEERAPRSTVRWNSQRSLATMSEHRLRRCITFHHRTIGSTRRNSEGR